MAQLSDEQLANIAHDFYLSKLNIGEISQKYNLSRYLITKALEDAEMRGIVKIKIMQGVKRNQLLEREFQKRFGLKEVFILHSYEDQDATVKQSLTLHLSKLKTICKKLRLLVSAGVQQYMA